MTRDDIARIIRESRQMAGLTQLQVGDALNRPQTTIAAWEAGRSQPDANTLFELFRVLGRSVDEAFGFTVESFNVTARERSHIEKYRTLDTYGQETVSAVLDLEYKRCTEQAATDLENSCEIIYTMPGYFWTKNAETDQPSRDKWEDLLLTKRPPRGASYVVTISDDSMEPTYYNGERLFIQSTVNIQLGQIGVFFMDNHLWVKELGDGVLISHNPAYAPRPITEDVRCRGAVLGVCDESYLK